MQARVQTAIDELDAKLGEEGRAGLWFLSYESEKWRIKRNVTRGRKRSFQRLPVKLYRAFQDDKEELEKFVLRLNNIDPKEQRALDKFEVDSAFFPSQMLQDYMHKLEAEIPTKQAARYTYRYAREHFIGFFIHHSPDPNVWYQKLQPAWADHLIEKDFSISVLKKIIHSANRLMKYLHHQRPDEIPLMIFEPLSKAMFARVRAKKELNGEGREKRKYIVDADYAVMKERISDELRPIFELSYKYGLRRNEAVGLYQATNKIRKGYLLINEQLKCFKDGEPIRRAPKFNKTRKINHWYCTPQECHDLISSMSAIGADAASHKFTEFTINLYEQNLISHPYVLHDCRHTFISNAVKEYDINTVSRAAGHSDISVTNEYLKDTRELEDEIFDPAS